MADTPKTTDKIYDTASPRLELMHDMTGDVTTIRQSKYLTRWPAESDESYKARREQMEFNNVVNETISTAVAKLFRKPVKYPENLDAILEEWNADVDGSGTSLMEYAKAQSFPAIRDGLFYTLIDVPYVAGIDSMTDAQKAQYDLSPKLRNVLFGDITNRVVDSKTGELVQCTIQEVVTVQDGRFGQAQVKQHRILNVEGGEVYQEIWRDNDKGDAALFEAKKIVTPGDGRGKKLVKIPLVPFYTWKIGPHNAKPYLLNQAYTMVSWLNITSQRTNALQDTADPMLVAIGRQPYDSNPDGSPKYADITRGTKKMLDVPENGDAKYLELQGNSLGEMTKKAEELQAAMERYKSSIQEKDASISVKQIGIENSDKISQLYSWSQSCDAWLDGILEITGAYMGIDYEAGCNTNKDFDEFHADKDKLAELRTQWTLGWLPGEKYFDLLQKGEVYPDNWTWEEFSAMQGQQPPLG